MNQKNTQEDIMTKLKQLDAEYEILELESQKLREQYSILKEKKNFIKEKMEEIANKNIKEIIYKKIS